MAPQKIAGVMETAIYANNLKASEEFYTKILGLEKMEGSESFCAFNAGGRSVFLLFRSGQTMQPVKTSGMRDSFAWSQRLPAFCVCDF